MERTWVRIVVPSATASVPGQGALLYRALHATGRTLQLLLVGTAGDVGIWLGCEPDAASTLATLVRSGHPDAELEHAPPPLPVAPLALAATRWRLAEHPAYPLRTVDAFEAEGASPLAMTLGAVATAPEGVTAVLSLALRPAGGGCARRSAQLQAALSAPSAPRPPDAEARVARLRRKAEQPAYRVSLRTACGADNPMDVERHHEALCAAMGQFAVVGCNALVPARRGRSRVWPGLLAGALEWRAPVLSPDELAAILQVPGPELVVPHLRRTRARRRELVQPMPAGILPLADTGHRDSHEPVGPTVEQLLSHAYVVGPSGTGKTTLLTGLVLSLLATGTAGIVLDPHGDLVREVLARVPEVDVPRLALFDLADPAHLPSLNPLALPDPAADTVTARAVRSAAVSALFADIWQLHRSVTPNLLHFLEAAVAALVACGHGTLADLPQFLTDPALRASVVREAADPRVTARWREFDALTRDERSRTVRAILNKAADFDRNPLLATVFGDPGPGLQLASFMDCGRVLVVSLPRGLVPEGTVELVGSVLVSLAYQTALAREARPPAARPPVVAVIDEFQEFALSTFAKALTATRKYGLGLVVANQNLSRIRTVSADVLETLLANAATMVSFRTAPSDAEALAPLMAPFGADDLTGLGPYQCYLRLPAPQGPQVVWGRTRPLPAAVRGESDVELLASALRRRLPGRPMVRPVARRPWTGL